LQSNGFCGILTYKYTANIRPMDDMDKKLAIKWYGSIDSTNLQAHREIGEAPEGSVWVADFQTAGRGQRGNSWESGSGKNLLFTLLLRPDFLHVVKQFSISQIAALAIVKYLESKGLSAKIKWPNDIYIGDKKICGILIEHTVSGANLSASILGIGININQTAFCSDAPNPISLILALGNGLELDRPQELAMVLEQLMQLYDSMYDVQATERRANPQTLAAINAEYHKYLYRKGEWHHFLEISGEEKREIMGKILGVNDFGCLLLECPDGLVKDYSFQQIRYIL
jgi:BirA family biotin operon repressor/biotin-[acetyl-CoA-carboxylase] ligase